MKVPNITDIEFGIPWKLHEKGGVAIPILIRGDGHREYVIFDEAEDVSFKDTGEIGTLRIINNADEYVFLRKGQILKGGTQTRALQASIIVAPNTTTFAPVKCIYASKGIRSGATMFAMSAMYTPRDVTKSLTASQSVTWSAIADHNISANAIQGDSIETSYLLTGGTRVAGRTRSHRIDDLEGNLSATVDSIDKALEKVPANHERQIGIMVVNRKGVIGFEIFDHPDSWAALSKGVVRNYSDILTNAGKEDLLALSDERAYEMTRDFMFQLQGAKGVSVFKENKAETFQIDDDEVEGEFTILFGGMVHVLASPKTGKKPKKKKERPVPIPAPWRRPPLPWTWEFEQQDEPRWRRTTTSSWGLNKEAESHHIINLLTKKRGYETLSALQEKAKTFTEIVNETGMSTRTVDKGLKEAKELGLVRNVYSGGRTAYELTSKGRNINPQKFKASYQ